MKKYKIGYTQGVFDMFHIGHLNLINNAKALCDYLIVGINSDELVEQYKHKTPVIGEEDRRKIVDNLKAVDQCIVVSTLDKLELHEKLHFDVIFIGDDWKGNSRWVQTEQEMNEIGVDVIFLPYTDGISSTKVRTLLPLKVEDDFNMEEGKNADGR